MFHTTTAAGSAASGAAAAGAAGGGGGGGRLVGRLLLLAALALALGLLRLGLLRVGLLGRGQVRARLLLLFPQLAQLRRGVLDPVTQFLDLARQGLNGCHALSLLHKRTRVPRCRAAKDSRSFRQR